MSFYLNSLHQLRHPVVSKTVTAQIRCDYGTLLSVGLSSHLIKHFHFLSDCITFFNSLMR